MSREILITGHPFVLMGAASMLRNVGVDFGRGSLNMYLESNDVSRDVIKPFLKRLGADPMGQWPLPEKQKTDTRLATRMRKALGGVRKPWAYSDAKIALLHKAFEKAFPEAAWVVVRDDPENIARACMARSYMKACETHDEWVAWVHHYDMYLDAIQGDVLEVEPSEFDPEALYQHCGLVDA